MAKFKPVDEGQFRRLAARASKPGTPFATRVRYDKRGGKIRLTLNTAIEINFDPRQAYGLAEASDEDLALVSIEGAGNAIRFESLDADFSIPRLLEGFLGPLDWSRREARAEASRRNGKLGGRPRKLREEEYALR